MNTIAKAKNTLSQGQTNKEKKEAGKGRPCLLYKGRGGKEREKKERGSEAGERKGERRARPHPFILFLKYPCPLFLFLPIFLPSHFPPIALYFQIQPTIATLCLCYAHKQAIESRKRNAMRWRSNSNPSQPLDNTSARGRRG